MNSVLSRCVGWWGCCTTHQDGGPVAEDMRTPVQCGEDDAVRAIHACVWRLQDNQRESTGSSDRTRLADESQTANLHSFTSWKSIEIFICLLCFSLCFSLRLWPLLVWRWSQERNLAGVWKNPGLLHAAKWSKIKSHSPGWRTVSVTYHLLKWFTFSGATWDTRASLLTRNTRCLLSRTISTAVHVT